MILNDTLRIVLDWPNAVHSILDKLWVIIGIVLPFCPSVITCTTLRPCLGLQPDQYLKVMSFLRSDKVKVSGLARLCRGLKKDGAWVIIWMHPANSIVHETRRMPVS